MNKTGNDIWYLFWRIILIGDSESRAQCDCDDILTFVVRLTGRNVLAFLWCVKMEILVPQLSGPSVPATTTLAGKQIHQRMQNFVRNPLVLIILLYHHLFRSYSRKTGEPLWAARGSYRVNMFCFCNTGLLNFCNDFYKQYLEMTDHQWMWVK